MLKKSTPLPPEWEPSPTLGDIRSQRKRDYCLQSQATNTAGFHRSQLGRPSTTNQREGFTQSPSEKLEPSNLNSQPLDQHLSCAPTPLPPSPFVSFEANSALSHPSPIDRRVFVMLGRSLPRVAARAFARQPVGKSTVRSHHRRPIH